MPVASPVHLKVQETPVQDLIDASPLLPQAQFQDLPTLAANSQDSQEAPLILMVATVFLKDLKALLAQLTKSMPDLVTEDPSMTGALSSSVRPADTAIAATAPVAATVVAASEVPRQAWVQGSASASAARAVSARALEKATAHTAAATEQATVREITDRLSGEMIDVRTDYLTFI